MTYKITITRTEPNPAYKPPKNTYDVMNQRYDVPQYSIYNALEVEITDEQFQRVRKAVLEAF